MISHFTSTNSSQNILIHYIIFLTKTVNFHFFYEKLQILYNFSHIKL